MKLTSIWKLWRFFLVFIFWKSCEEIWFQTFKNFQVFFFQNISGVVNKWRLLKLQVFSFRLFHLWFPHLRLLDHCDTHWKKKHFARGQSHIWAPQGVIHLLRYAEQWLFISPPPFVINFEPKKIFFTLACYKILETPPSLKSETRATMKSEFPRYRRHTALSPNLSITLSSPLLTEIFRGFFEFFLYKTNVLYDFFLKNLSKLKKIFHYLSIKTPPPLDTPLLWYSPQGTLTSMTW